MSVKILLGISFLILSLSSYAGIPSLAIYYPKMGNPTAAGFYYFTNVTQGSLYICANSGGTVQGAMAPYSGALSPYFSTSVDSSAFTSTISYSGSPSTPQPIKWTISPYNQCISGTGGTAGLNNSIISVISGLRTNQTLTYSYTYNGTQVFQITSQSPVSAYLPPTAKFTDNTSGEVTQLYFVGCSDDSFSNNRLACCYSSVQGDASLCSVNKQ